MSHSARDEADLSDYQKKTFPSVVANIVKSAKQIDIEKYMSEMKSAGFTYAGGRGPVDRWVKGNI